MAKIRKVIRTCEPDGTPLTFQYHFNCPGCHCEHAFDHRWNFNYDFDKPTIFPSFLQKGFIGFKNAESDEKVYGVCHSFITDGKIQFLGDCTHDLKDQTVDLLDVSEL